MAVENGLGGQTNTDEATTSKSNGEAEKTSSMNGHQEDSKKSKEDEKTNTVPFRKLFSFVDSTDVLLVLLGTIGSIGNGVCMPLMTVLFGELTNSFGGNQNDRVVDVVSKVCIKFMYLAVGAAVAAFLLVELRNLFVVCQRWLVGWTSYFCNFILSGHMPFGCLHILRIDPGLGVVMGLVLDSRSLPFAADLIFVVDDIQCMDLALFSFLTEFAFSVCSMGFLKNPQAFLRVLQTVIEITSYRFILFTAGFEALDAAVRMIAAEASCLSQRQLSEDCSSLFNNRLFCFNGYVS
uniref:ABC transmembrane type-1 domain-containing protein n=2 Tax=Fagus sylvatica TaxID=28930 RepID=A0A2N9G7X0_FAGSY